MELTVADEIADASMGRPHVVLLGAGGSRAAFPTGEKNGRRLPLMADFMDVVPVRGILERAGIQADDRNFEDVYAEIFAKAELGELRLALEDAVFSYFASLELPTAPTVYDYLVLSLRSKDVIATFNWDPFLIQAVRRNRRAMKGCPKLLFLHGTVLQGFCQTDSVHGVRGFNCSRCGEQFAPVRLLYPIGQKSYETEPAIKSAWDAVRAAFEGAFMITVFGYGAPQSDRSAIELLQMAWGSAETRSLEQVEIIDVRDEEALLEGWKNFIHTHHYEIHRDFSESWIAHHPTTNGRSLVESIHGGRVH